MGVIKLVEWEAILSFKSKNNVFSTFKTNAFYQNIDADEI